MASLAKVGRHKEAGPVRKSGRVAVMLGLVSLPSSCLRFSYLSAGSIAQKRRQKGLWVQNHAVTTPGDGPAALRRRKHRQSPKHHRHALHSRLEGVEKDQVGKRGGLDCMSLPLTYMADTNQHDRWEGWDVYNNLQQMGYGSQVGGGPQMGGDPQMARVGPGGFLGQVGQRWPLEVSLRLAARYLHPNLPSHSTIRLSISPKDPTTQRSSSAVGRSSVN